LVRINNNIHKILDSIDKNLQIIQGNSLKYSVSNQKAIINRLSEDLSTLIHGLESILIVVNSTLNENEDPN
tara:strand:+ start:4447 stop:4659 length:213 start_codon:yes stop_codon:yes gene_type:complete